MAASVEILDFTNVKERSFSPKRMPAGDYVGVIVAVDDHVKEGKDKQWVFTIKLKSNSSAVYPYYCQLTETTLWKIRNLFIAAGKQVPKKKAKVDPNKIVGAEIGLTLEDDEYEGKEKSSIAATFPADEVDSEPTPEPAPAARPAMKKAGAKKAAPVVEEDEDDLDEDDDLEEDIDDL